MSANLIEERNLSKARQIIAHAPVDRRKAAVWSLPPVSSDDELRFVAKAVLGLIVLGVAPLLLFHFITRFDPDFFSISVTPN